MMVETSLFERVVWNRNQIIQSTYMYLSRKKLACCLLCLFVYVQKYVSVLKNTKFNIIRAMIVDKGFCIYNESITKRIILL